MNHNPTARSGDNVGDNAIEHAGYVEQFTRTLGRFESFAVAFSFVSVTTGLFSSYGTVLNTGGPMGMWTWPVVAIGTTLVALVYGMLASRIPLSGYSYQWASRLTNPIIGWWFGWVSFAFLSIVTVAVDYGLSQVAIFPLFDIEYTATRGALMTLAILVIQAILIIWSTPITTKINNLAVGAELIAMVVLILGIGGAVIFGGHGHASNLMSTGAIPHHGYYGWLGPFMLSALLGCYTLVGWESAANLAEETHNPKQVVPRAMVRALMLSGGVGLLFLMAITTAMDNVQTITADSAPVARIIHDTLGNGAEKAVLVVVSMAIFACGLVIMVTNSRLIHAMARDERLPAAHLLSAVPRPTGGPTFATILGAGVSAAIVLAFMHNPDALAQLMGASSLMPAMLYAATVALYIATRHTFTHHPDDFQLGKWELPVVIGAAIWLLLEVSIFLFPSDFRTAQKYALGSVAIGVVVFAVGFLSKRQAFSRERGKAVDSL